MAARNENLEQTASKSRLHRQLFVMVPVVAAALVTGCASDDTIDPATCDAPERYRVNEVRWPADHEQARALGFDLNGDDTVDNQLGTLVVSLDNYFVDPFDLSDAATHHMVSVAWDLEVQRCAGERARVTIGGGEPLVGTVADGVYTARGDAGELPVAALFAPTDELVDAGWRTSARSAVRLAVIGDQLVGDVGMAPAQADVSSAVVAAMTAFIDSRKQLQPELLEVFDRDGDGTIVENEVSENTLTRSMLAPDLADVSALSMGFAIVATRR